MNTRELTELCVWAIRYVDYFRKNETYNEYRAIIGRQSRKQEVYETCQNFLDDLKELVENFKTKKEELISWGGTETEETLYQ